MKSKTHAILAASALACSLAGPSNAQQAATTATQTASAASSAAFSDGEVRKVDKDAKKITLKHGEIKNLDMPPMTMVFAVKDEALLSAIKTGDKVQFKAIDDGGKLTVVEIQAAK
jgi:Cu(I)/Ag(I) efflux system protein CusF